MYLFLNEYTILIKVKWVWFFYCCSHYESISINHHLLPGLDLAQQFVGVLNKFRLGPVAFMTDIQAMIYQVKVPEMQKSHLYFLWWEEGNLGSTIANHQMCTHLFRTVSSPGKANFPLEKSASNNGDNFGKDAAESILNNLHGDDLLKSEDDYAAKFKKKNSADL